MDVLVFSGPGVSPTCLAHTLSSLRALLFPNYSVRTITSSALKSQPWAPSCALLVLPGGRDVPYVSALKDANPSIRTYLEEGGSYLGFCAGAYYACRRVEWEVGTPMEVVGDRMLSLYPGTCEGCVYPGFQYESEDGARAVKVDAVMGANAMTTFAGLYYNGGGHFVGVDTMEGKGVQAIALYADEDDGKGKAAAVVCDVGAGRAVLWNVHIEFPLTSHPALSTFSKLLRPPSQEELDVLERERWGLLRHTLEILGLSTPESEPDFEPVLLPTFLTSSGAEEVSLDRVKSKLDLAPGHPLQDSKDTFYFHGPSAAHDLIKQSLSRPIADLSEENLATIPKDFIVFDGGELPLKEQTPFFDLRSYYDALAASTNECKRDSSDTGSGSAGDVLLYGERVTSTQTLLDKNPTLLGVLPSPLLFIASHQLAARGRGQNKWVAPYGCLQMSLLVRPPSTIRIPLLVFVQYIFGLAVVEACREVMGSAGDRVRLKWPNDIYGAIPTNHGEEYKKLGGVLVSNNFSAGKADLIIGCGLNVLNPKPTISLQQLMPANSVPLTMEQIAASIMAKFDGMWRTYIRDNGSFDSFMDLYLERWLHSDQLVKVTSTSPPLDVRIVGITPDHGLLRTIPVKSSTRLHTFPEFVDLQPDGNSFDMMAGLIRTKT